MKKKIFPLFILASLFFMSGVVLQSENPSQYVKLKHSVKSFVKKIQLQKLSKAASRSCNIPQISTIPRNSHLVVGHLYKHPSVNNKNPLGKLPELIYKNRQNIKSVIFTGDIFYIPSLEKWNQLKATFEELDIQYFIAPGNHDVGINNGPARDLFRLVFKLDYPFIWKEKDSIFLIEDSTINSWHLSQKSLDLINKNKSINSVLHVFTHNIILDELYPYANSKIGKPEKITSVTNIFDGLEESFSKVRIITGDTGAFAFLPTKACYTYKNIFSIANGLGPRESNEILIIKDNEIFSFLF